MKRRTVTVILTLSLCGAALAGCNSSGGSSAASGSPGTYDYLACAAMNDVFLGEYKSTGDEHREALDAEGYGAKAESAAIRAAAVALKNDANAADQSAVTADVTAYETACVTLGIGANDNG